MGTVIAEDGTGMVTALPVGSDCRDRVALEQACELALGFYPLFLSPGKHQLILPPMGTYI